MDAKVVAPEKPFFLDDAPGARHVPHHAPKDWIEKYKGRLNAGYEAMREGRPPARSSSGARPREHALAGVINPIGTTETSNGPTASPSCWST